MLVILITYKTVTNNSFYCCYIGQLIFFKLKIVKIEYFVLKSVVLIYCSF